MVQIRLPKGSKVRKGKVISAKEVIDPRKVKIYRWNPEEGNANPRIDTYIVDRDGFGHMALDILINIKEKLDPTITFRRSCREGVCGSCAMNINGTNSLACIKDVGKINGDITFYPLPHMPVIKDLVPDLTEVYSQYEQIKPWLQADKDVDLTRERPQTHTERENLGNSWECVLCYCCSASCPSYWWNGDEYLGPATLLQASRWINDSRDNQTDKRLDDIDDTFKLYRCHTILNCTKSCPKGLNPAQAIGDIKRKIVKKHLKGK